MRKIILVLLLSTHVVAATTTDASLAQPCTPFDEQAAATQQTQAASAGKCRPTAEAAVPNTSTNIGANTGANTGANVMPVDLTTSVTTSSAISATTPAAASQTESTAPPAVAAASQIQRVQHNSTLEWLGSSMLLILVGFWLWMTRK